MLWSKLGVTLACEKQALLWDQQDNRFVWLSWERSLPQPCACGVMEDSGTHPAGISYVRSFQVETPSPRARNKNRLLSESSFES